jgi:hypothetical protein
MSKMEKSNCVSQEKTALYVMYKFLTLFCTPRMGIRTNDRLFQMHRLRPTALETSQSKSFDDRHIYTWNESYVICIYVMFPHMCNVKRSAHLSLNQEAVLRQKSL